MSKQRYLIVAEGEAALDILEWDTEEYIEAERRFALRWASSGFRLQGFVVGVAVGAGLMFWLG